MNNSLHRLERLVLDLSNVSRIERGIFSLKKKIIDFNQFINNEILSYSKLLGDEIEFNLSDVSETVFIEIDKERIGQVLANVIDNATKNTYPETRKIKFSTLIEKDFVKISIEDNGAGIKLKHLKKIFGQFVTIPTKYSDKGSGIGLYLSKVIIEGHGGQITAYSEGLEKGTRIEIILPKIEIEK
jgi:signal transduction histidine kinase